MVMLLARAPTKVGGSSTSPESGLLALLGPKRALYHRVSSAPSPVGCGGVWLPLSYSIINTLRPQSLKLSAHIQVFWPLIFVASRINRALVFFQRI